MSHELFYTSAPRGLHPGSNGYCTVAATQGLPGPLRQKLETLSDYPEEEGGNARPPIALSHLRVAIAGKTWSVLSRSCMAGVDHSRRRIFFTHHVALDPAELPPGGPAWLMGQRDFLETRWDGQVRELPIGRSPVKGSSTPAVCRAWQLAADDAGWAGVLAEEFEKNPNRPVYILYPPSVDPLPLLQEALALLPAERRWLVTFSTLYRSLPQDVPCVWRCLPLEAPEARKVRSLPGVLVLDLGQPLRQAEGGCLVEAARSGKTPRIFTPPRVAAPQPATTSGWKHPALLPAEAEDESQEPERELSKVEVPQSRAGSGPRRGSWLVPLAVGLLLGVLLIGGGAVAGWRVLEQANDKALANARDKAQQEKEKAIADTKADADKQQEKALQDARNASKKDIAKAVTAFDKEQQEKTKAIKAIKKLEQELEAAKKAAASLKGMVSKADLDKALGPRNEALKILVSELFSEKDKAPDQIRNQLEAIQKGKESKLAELGPLLVDWVDHERQALRKKEFRDGLSNLDTLLKICEKLKDESAKRDLIEDPKYRNNYEAAQKLYKRLKETTSVLARRELEVRFARRLSPERLPIPKPAPKKK